MPKFKIASGQTILIDAVDLEWVSKYNWSLYGESIRRREYSKSILLAQEILKRKKLTGKVRFKNLNKLDYRRNNLTIIVKKPYKKKNKIANSGFKYIYETEKGFRVHSKNGEYLANVKTLDEAIKIQKENIRKRTLLPPPPPRNTGHKYIYAKRNGFQVLNPKTYKTLGTVKNLDEAIKLRDSV